MRLTMLGSSYSAPAGSGPLAQRVGTSMDYMPPTGPLRGMGASMPLDPCLGALYDPTSRVDPDTGFREPVTRDKAGEEARKYNVSVDDVMGWVERAANAGATILEALPSDTSRTRREKQAARNTLTTTNGGDGKALKGAMPWLIAGGAFVLILGATRVMRRRRGRRR